MRRFSVYRLSDGMFTGRTFGGTIVTDAKMAASLGDGEACLEGQYDHLSQRVDLSGPVPHVVDYKPPQPSVDHEWDAITKRWVMTAAATEKMAGGIEAFYRIKDLEIAQSRATRELLLELSGLLHHDSEAVRRLRATDESAAEWRKKSPRKRPL